MPSLPSVRIILYGNLTSAGFSASAVEKYHEKNCGRSWRRYGKTRKSTNFLRKVEHGAALTVRSYTVFYLKTSLLVCAKAGLYSEIWIRSAAYTPATQVISNR